MIRASNTIIAVRALFDASGPGEEGEHLSEVNVISTLRTDLIAPAERMLRAKAQQIVREFSLSTLSGSSTYVQTEDAKSRTTSALQSLYILSPQPAKGEKYKNAKFDAKWMVEALQDYLRTSLTSSIAALVRALGAYPTLERILLEVSSRCQNIVALEILLESIKPPALPSTTAPLSLLQPLLTSLETSSLPSYFWRSLGSALSPRVLEMVNKGGVQARTLRSNKNAVRDMIHDCVLNGSQAPAGMVKMVDVGRRREEGRGEGWEREIAVMAGAVVGHLGR
jgi:hypothetical protein